MRRQSRKMKVRILPRKPLRWVMSRADVVEIIEDILDDMKWVHFNDLKAEVILFELEKHMPISYPKETHHAIVP